MFRFSRRAVALVWSTSRALTVGLGAGALLAGLLPGAIAWVGKLLVDAVVAATEGGGAREQVLRWVLLEAALVVGLAAVQRGLGIVRALLRAQLGNRVNVMILEKALELELRHFEDAELYDRMTRARREASSRPLSLVVRTFDAVQATISLASYAALLAVFSPYAVGLLLVAGVPSFIAEAKFAGDAFRLFRFRTPETREQLYLETVLAREDHVKEVKLFGLGRRFLDRYQAIFEQLYAADRKLTLRRGLWALGLGVVGTAAFYGAYLWIALAAVAGDLTLGAMTMYVVVFKQGQAGLAQLLGDVGGMYEDNLYLSSLYELLDEPVARPGGAASAGPDPGDGLRFEDVGFTYPGEGQPALSHVTVHVPPGSKLAIVGDNGSGKTTLVKLLARLYEPTEGRILLEGRDLREWDPEALRARIGVIFQDFVRYQLRVGENIGAGDDRAYLDRARWSEASDKGLASPFIEAMPRGFDTQLGKWFKDGRELSGGQWQKIALSRAFMRRDASILVLDEPTAAIDAEAEAKIFGRFRELTAEQIAIVISHRFSTVRMADAILVLDGGRVVERGSHDELVAAGGRYATLFGLQAAGYR
ncbi:MAG: ABC transporter ATP-binding protein [Deltaproteobacteria bacterium]|nr:ABC transporter ATP-binding protein [Deltaproteobacteria bacterium]